jgi:hypothetical protein
MNKFNIYILFIFFGFTLSNDCCIERDIAINECNGMTGCYIPQCSNDCNWESTQCWSSTGYCWCVDQNGFEIEGSSMPSWQGYPDCEDNNEDCYDLNDIQFGACEMLLGIGLYNGNCNYISGCDSIIDNVDYSSYLFDSMEECEQNCSLNECDEGFIEINDLCFHEGDYSFIQKLINNSYASQIDLGCEDWDGYCGSPNPSMDSTDSWMWVTVDGEYYNWAPNGNGIVDPLELGIQEWENGRLTSIMCGAYIYCQLSGSIPEEINELTSLRTLRLEGNYLSGFIPETVCELDSNHNDYLEFDLSWNKLCPPYPYCIEATDFWGQYTSECYEFGDINYDLMINIQDIILLISFIINNIQLDFQELTLSDINYDDTLNVLDIIEITNIILGVDN